MKILEIVTSVSFLFSIIRMTTPILYASMSYLVADLAGVTNIGIEGMMLTCALIGVVASAAFGGNAFLGFTAAVVVGALLGILMCFIVTKLKTDPTITGIAYNLTAAGGTVFLLYLAVGEKGISSSLKSGVLPQVNIPVIKDIPVLGTVVSGHNVLTYVAVLLIIVLSIFLYKTSLGLHIRSCGENPEALESVGVHVLQVKYIALAISGMLAAMGGRLHVYGLRIVLCKRYDGRQRLHCDCRRLAGRQQTGADTACLPAVRSCRCLRGQSGNAEYGNSDGAGQHHSVYCNSNCTCNLLL